MKVAAAQVRCTLGDYAANVARHLVRIDEAHHAGCGIVVFPELSLSGYTTRLARALALTVDDPRLAPLQAAVDRLGTFIAVGAPLRAAGGSGLWIGTIVLRPGAAPLVHTKQFLHADEVPYFVPGDAQLYLALDGVRAATAICYESLQPEHAATVAAGGARLYLASVAKPQRGVERARAHYPTIAARHGMAVVMANAVGPTDDFVSAGQSAAWDPSGNPIASLGAHEEGLLVVDVSGPA